MPNFKEENIENMLIAASQKIGWTYIESSSIPRTTDSVLVETWLKDALIRINHITESQAEIVIQRLRTRIVAGNNPDALIANNDDFRKLLLEKNSFPIGTSEDPNINIKFFSDNPDENYCVVTNQWEFPRESIHGGKRLDWVFLINGIPVVIGEAKTPVRPSITWGDGAKDILHYQKSIPEMFVSNILSFATEGKEFQYASLETPIAKWGPWYADESRSHGMLADVRRNFASLMKPNVLLDIYRYYTVFSTNDKKEKIKIVCRCQQYFGAEAIVNRVLSTIRNGKGPKKGLIWHFQGSGKSWLMVFAAQKLRLQPVLKSPTVVIVDDRIDLEDQITGDFTKAEIPNLESANSKEDLRKFFESDQRKIFITTIFKFADVNKKLSERENIILMVDEAHRTQEGNLGMKMRKALPNAFFFGLTGTPINKNDRNTFAAFGAVEDESGYISKYSFQDSIDDGATLELNFKTVPVELHLKDEELQEAFDEMADEYNLSESEKNELTKRTSVEAFFTDPQRINAVCKFIVNHFYDYIEPSGMKAQVVVYNRDCCVKYKKAIDALLGVEDATCIVMDTNGDKSDEYKEYKLDKNAQNKLLDKFRDPLSPLKFVIVTSKLLTGFNAPILQVMYLDKPMKDHTLLQAICRTNRKYTDAKKCGLIVDFVGLFDNVARSLAFDEETVRTVIKNIEEIKAMIPSFISECVDFFPGVDRTINDWQGLESAQQCLADEKKCTDFAKHFCRLQKAWETVSPDPVLETYKTDYIWLSQVYQSIKPVSDDGVLIWAMLGPKTIDLVHKHVDSIDIGQPLEDLVVDSDIINTVLEDAKKNPGKIITIEKMLKLRLGMHKNNPNFKVFAEKLEELRERMRENLITSMEFLKGLLELAKKVLEEEKRVNQPEDKRAKAKAALTELFESIKTKNTAIIVENIVRDIDENVVEIIRKFKDAFKSVTARQEIRKKLRSILWLKYAIKDEDIFNKAYEYIEMYY